MAASQKGKLLAAHWDRLAVNPESGAVYRYSFGIWSKLSDSVLERVMVSIFEEHETYYTEKGIKSIVATMKLQIPLIDLSSQSFSPHDPENWLMNHNGITYTPPAPGENLQAHAPGFTHWLSHATGGNAQKAERIKAALFMVLANRHD